MVLTDDIAVSSKIKTKVKLLYTHDFETEFSLLQIYMQEDSLDKKVSAFSFYTFLLYFLSSSLEKFYAFIQMMDNKKRNFSVCGWKNLS